MKILQLGKFYPVLGGVEKVMFDLTVGLSETGLSEVGLSETGLSEVGLSKEGLSEAGLSETGVECDMMCAGSDGRGTEVIRLNPHGRILCHRTLIEAAKTTIAPSMVTRLRRIAKDYDIIHIHHPDPMAAMALRLSGYKGKVVLHWHSDILSQKALFEILSADSELAHQKSRHYRGDNSCLPCGITLPSGSTGEMPLPPDRNRAGHQRQREGAGDQK